MAQYVPDDENVCWLFVGTTGAGKSTLVNELTNSNVATSSSAYSCTYEASMYNSTLNNITLMDTVGLEDTNNLSSNDILQKICSKLGPYGCTNVKIIWIVKPQNKVTPELQKQARFINSLKNGSIWSSVIILVKQGIDEDASQGAKIAAKENNCQNINNIPCFDIHILDLINNYQKNKCYKHSYKSSLTERSEDGFLYKKEIKNWLNNQLSEIKMTRISMRKVYYHSGSQDKSMYHPGQYKMGGWNKTGYWALGIATAGIGNGVAAIWDGHEACRQWRCCNKTDRYAAACTVKRRWWTCCNKDVGSTGCESKWVPE